MVLGPYSVSECGGSKPTVVNRSAAPLQLRSVIFPDVVLFSVLLQQQMLLVEVFKSNVILTDFSLEIQNSDCYCHYIV